MTTNLYLAYGSNLNLAQMRYRCPDARVVGYTYLPDRKLAFRGSQTGNYLTLDEAPGAYPGVPCGVFEISERDQASRWIGMRGILVSTAAALSLWNTSGTSVLGRSCP